MGFSFAYFVFLSFSASLYPLSFLSSFYCTKFINTVHHNKIVFIDLFNDFLTSRRAKIVYKELSGPSILKALISVSRPSSFSLSIGSSRPRFLTIISDFIFCFSKIIYFIYKFCSDEENEIYRFYSKSMSRADALLCGYLKAQTLTTVGMWGPEQ